MDNNAISSLIDAVGAVAELCYLYYKTTVDRGAPHDVAMDLTGQFMTTILFSGSFDENRSL